MSPDALLGVTVSAANRNSHIDLMYVYRTAENKNLEVGVSLLDTALDIKERMIARELAPLNDRKCYLWAADVDADDTLDVVLLFPDESKSLYVLRGGANDAFGEARLVSADVRIANRQQLSVTDVDGDKLPDIIVNNHAAGGIGWFRNEGRMSFEPWKFLIAAESGGHFALGDINRDGIGDIAVSYPEVGSLMVFSGRLFWKSRDLGKTSH